MKRTTTADATVSLVQFCSLLVLTVLLLLVLGGAKLNVSAAGLDRGYLTNSQELSYIRQQAQRGVQPFAALVNNFMGSISAPTAWSYGTVGREYFGSGGICVSNVSDTAGVFLSQRGGAQGVYEKMIAYHLTGNLDYAIVARQKILEVTASYGFGGNLYSGGNQCILELGFAIPVWIQAADLLEPTSIWSVNDKRIFQNWLATAVYPKVAWASHVRRNNWGTAGSVAASMIGDYLSDYSITLTEVSPAARQLSPAQAVLQANADQLQRMNTLWKGDSQCNIYGIRSYGGIPDELRRGTTGCLGQWLLTNDSSFSYQILQIEHLTFHAEYLSRRGNMSIYNNMASDGSGSLLKAIIFVIANPLKLSNSFDWTSSKRGVLFVANTVYRNSVISSELSFSTTVRRGSMVAFAELTHAIDITASQLQTSASPVPSSTATTRPSNTPTAVASLAATPAQTTNSTITLSPIADAYVTSNSPSSNFGTDSSLRTDASPTIRNYLRFSVPPFSGRLVSASLRVFAKSSLPLGYSVHSSSGSWAESTITFSNAPAFGSVLAMASPNAGNLWTEVNLTSLITGAGDYNFVMASSSTTSTAYTSREGLSNKPQLVLVFDNSVPLTTLSLNASLPIATATLLPSSSPILPTNTLIPSLTLVTNTAMPASTALPTDASTAIPTSTETVQATALATSTATAIPTEIATTMPTNTPMVTEMPLETATEMATQNP